MTAFIRTLQIVQSSYSVFEESHFTQAVPRGFCLTLKSKHVIGHKMLIAHDCSGSMVKS